MSETVYDIDAIDLSIDGALQLQKSVHDADASWYWTRRMRALTKAGIIAAVDWDPNLHPRGRDGKFIETLGWVRWLFDGKWRRGRVTLVDGDGTITVRQAVTGKELKFTPKEAARTLYAAPKTKATIDLPDVKTGEGKPGFTKIGGQGGSNPGGLYKVGGTVKFTRTTTARDALQALQDDDKGVVVDVSVGDSEPSKAIFDKLSQGILLDEQHNTWYIKYGTTLTDQNGNEVDIDDVFGAPNTGERQDRKDAFKLVKASNEGEEFGLVTTALSMSSKAPTDGDRFYVKYAKSDEHARNEVLANQLYELAGVPMPEVTIGDDGRSVASKIVQGTDVLKLQDAMKDEKVLSQIRRNMVIDAWLANWDVVGQVYDNIVVADGVGYRIDAGGSLLYRAQGGAKGASFGDKVVELKSLSDKTRNPTAAAVFGGVTADEIKDGAERLRAISPQKIREMVEQYDMPSSLADKLIARRSDILHQVGLPDITPATDVSVAKKVSVPAPSPVKDAKLDVDALPSSISGMYWHPGLKNFVYGTAPTGEQAVKVYDSVLSGTELSGQKLATPEVMSVSAARQHDGPVYRRQFNQLWRVDFGSVNLNGPSGPEQHMTLTEVRTGETMDRTMPLEHSFEFITSSNPEAYENAYRVARAILAARVTNAITNEDALVLEGMNSNLNGFLRTSAVAGPSDFENAVGQWMIVGTHVVRVDAYYPDKSVVHVTNLDGSSSSFSAKGVWSSSRKPSPASMFNDAAEMLYAKNLISLKNEDKNSSAPDLTPGEKTMQSIAAGPDVVVSDPVSVTTPVEVDPESTSAVHPAITAIGEKFKLADLIAEDDLEQFVGKKVYMRLVDKPTNPTHKGYVPTDARGVMTIQSIDKTTSGSVSHIDMTLVDQTGRTHRETTWSSKKVELFEVDAALAPITQFQLKKTGVIVVNGVEVGTWMKTGGYWSRYEYTLKPEYSISGKEIRMTMNNKSDIRPFVTRLLVTPGTKTHAVEKTTETKLIEKKLREADVQFSKSLETGAGGAAVTLLDGAIIKKDMWVISSTDGQIGQVDEVVTSSKYAGYVKVKTPDGKLKWRSAKTLSAAGDQKEGTIPPASPLYKDVLLADGSHVFPSQTVTRDNVEMTVVEVKPDGFVKVQSADGKRTWVSASKLAAVKQYETVTINTSEPSSPRVLDESWKIKAKGAKIPYSAPGGVTIPQPDDAVITWRQFAPTRKLTADQFVPQIGMKVRNKKGKQLVITRIARSHDSVPSRVWVYDPETPYDDPKPVQVSTLFVDHAAELATPTGDPLPKISGVHFSGPDQGTTFPTGTVVYSYSKDTWVNGRKFTPLVYLAALPDGTVKRFDRGGVNTIDKDEAKSLVVRGKLTKIAYVDELSDTMATLDELAVGDMHITGDLWIHSNEEGALEKLKAEVAQKKIDMGIVEPEPFSGNQSHLISLPSPKQSTSVAGNHVVAIPGHEADPEQLKKPSAVAGSHSIADGIEALKQKMSSGDPGARTLYSMGDSDYIEDMSIRMQSVVDENGNDMVELRFHLLEDKIDGIAKQLIVNEKDVKGGWVTSGVVGVKDLVEGDSVSVRIGMSGALKVAETPAPNARVVGVPEKIGVSKAGLDAYKVKIQLASGDITEIVLEDRAVPSIATYQWDPDKINYSPQFSGNLNPLAMSSGWSIRNSGAVAYEAADGSKTMLDKDGRKIVGGTAIKNISGHNGAYRLRYDAGDGAHLSVQLTHPGSEERLSIITHNGANTSIRSTVNGEVLIRVSPDDPDALRKISEMMSSVGIPVDKQGQPSAQDLRKMALNKIDKQFSATYKHMKRPDVTGDADATAAVVLSKVTSLVKDQLGRDVTMDDVLLRVTDEGRVSVVVSDDVARAIAKRAGFTNTYHAFSSGGLRSSIFTSKTGTGLMSTDERWSQGIVTSGMSSQADVKNDSGNRVYFRLSNAGKNKTLDHSGNVYLSPVAVAKQLDWYYNTGDRYGRRLTANHDVYGGYFGGGNEIMIKRKIDLPQFGFVVLGSQSAVDAKIAEIKAEGVTHVNGRPIEDIIVVAGTKTVEDLGEIGATVGTEIPITAIT